MIVSISPQRNTQPELAATIMSLSGPVPTEWQPRAGGGTGAESQRLQPEAHQGPFRRQQPEGTPAHQLD